MDHRPDPTGLYSLAAATHPHIEWGARRRAAIVAGRGRCLSPEEERIAATDELLARCIAELIQLAKCAALAGVPTLTCDCRRAIEHSSAALLRLLDSALAAHGRDQRYDVTHWRTATEARAAAVAADLPARGDEDPWPLPAAIDDAAHDIAATLVACHRERMSVPEHITSATSELLVVYAAMAAG